jgi:hypothetical protein
MEDSEQVLAIIEGLSSDDSIDSYNLVLTTKRIVMMCTLKPLVNPEVGMAKGGLVGWAFASLIEKSVEAKMNEEKSRHLTLDEILQKNKKSYAINHEDIIVIKLHKGLVNSKLIVKSQGSQESFSFNKNIKKIYYTLLQAQALSGKVSLSR